ncbi:hypothetical protein BDF21DRAFT_417108 [Thamnidium elegans]|nr:hypothetical protein BDF21DRAFT_417108 [Thamnidium elegans]
MCLYNHSFYPYFSFLHCNSVPQIFTLFFLAEMWIKRCHGTSFYPLLINCDCIISSSFTLE